MAQVRLEVVGWLGSAFGERASGRLHMEEPVEVETSVGDFLQLLSQKYPDFQRAMFQEDGQLADLVNVVLNDRLVSLPGEQGSPLRDGDTVVLIPAYAGG
ncbi:MAG: MoaD/ThiS family protein [Chloroflexi bacterium]|nr:MoaD/ThiS family protein [Chloroflexota bacterium]